MKNNENVRVACLTLINAIVSTPEDLDFRIHLRTEFVRHGLVDVIEVTAWVVSHIYVLLIKALDEEDGEDLQVQLKVFKDYQDGDVEEFAQRYKI